MRKAIVILLITIAYLIYRWINRKHTTKFELHIRRRYLIKNATVAEKKALMILRGLGISCNFQEIMGFYIVDFVDHKKKIILEIDGKIHDDQDEYDDKRSWWLSRLGYDVYRIENNDVNKSTIRNIWNNQNTLQK